MKIKLIEFLNIANTEKSKEMSLDTFKFLLYAYTGKVANTTTLSQDEISSIKSFDRTVILIDDLGVRGLVAQVNISIDNKEKQIKMFIPKMHLAILN